MTNTDFNNNISADNTTTPRALGPPSRWLYRIRYRRPAWKDWHMSLATQEPTARRRALTLSTHWPDAEVEVHRVELARQWHAVTAIGPLEDHDDADYLADDWREG